MLAISFILSCAFLNGALPLRVTDIVSSVLVFPSHTKIRIETVCIVTLLRGLSLGRQAEQEEERRKIDFFFFFLNFEKKADIFFSSHQMDTVLPATSVFISSGEVTLQDL